MAISTGNHNSKGVEEQLAEGQGDCKAWFRYLSLFREDSQTTTAAKNRPRWVVVVKKNRSKSRLVLT